MPQQVQPFPKEKQPSNWRWFLPMLLACALVYGVFLAVEFVRKPQIVEPQYIVIHDPSPTPTATPKPRVVKAKPSPTIDLSAGFVDDEPSPRPNNHQP